MQARRPVILQCRRNHRQKSVKVTTPEGKGRRLSFIINKPYHPMKENKGSDSPVLCSPIRS